MYGGFVVGQMVVVEVVVRCLCCLGVVWMGPMEAGVGSDWAGFVVAVAQEGAARSPWEVAGAQQLQSRYIVLRQL